MKGLIALDIDGTLTASHHTIPDRVAKFLKELNSSGWEITLVTGRPFCWAYSTLTSLNFPYYFAIQNGAIILKMPEEKIVKKRYLNPSIFSQMEEICADEPSDFVVYGGYEINDQCFYRPGYFEQELLSYVESRAKTFNENWIPVDTYQTLKISTFPSVKCFGTRESALKISQKIKDKIGLHAPMIHDPYNWDYYVVQATQNGVNKGGALKDVVQLYGVEKPKIIAAGDDLNDVSMLELADVRIVMATAPEEMHKLADIVASSAEEEGIIEGLKQAL